MDSGPDHAKEFEATVRIRGRQVGLGRGRSKKQAEQAAAKKAWEQLSAELASAGGAMVGREGRTAADGGPEA
jgi:ribonuclease-3